MEAYIGEVRAFPYRFAPVGESSWLICDGKSYPVALYQALFSIIGVTYGGTPPGTFQVPDLRTRIPVGIEGALNLGLGEASGENLVTLTLQEIPAHRHAIKTEFTSASTDLSNAPDARCAISRTFNQFDFSNEVLVSSGTLDPQTIEVSGQGMPHENRQPVQAVTYFICHQGEYPSRP